MSLDSLTLAELLDARWPDAVGEQRASTDETHRLALVHPLYDGFISLHVTARTELADGVFVLPEPALEHVVTSHHRIGHLARGQELPIDLELHPGAVPTGGVSGLLRIVDVAGTDVAPAVRLTVATDASVECELAGAVDGPWPEPEAFERAVAELLAGQGSVRRLARRIAALTDGGSDPGWSRLPWRRG